MRFKHTRHAELMRRIGSVLPVHPCKRADAGARPALQTDAQSGATTAGQTVDPGAARGSTPTTPSALATAPQGPGATAAAHRIQAATLADAAAVSPLPAKVHANRAPGMATSLLADAFPAAPPPAPAPPAASAPASVPQLATQDDIARLEPPFIRALAGEFDLAGLSGRICPVALAGGKAAVFVLADYATGDQADEVERMVGGRGYHLATPSRYVLPAPLLLAVARGQLTAGSLTQRRTFLSDPRRSALAAAFEDVVAWGARHNASDVHFNVFLQRSESEVRFTLGGRYVAPPRFRRMPTATMMEMLAVAWMNVRGGNGAVFDPLVEQQGRIRVPIDGVMHLLRWASLATDAGPSVCLRILRLEERAEAASPQSLGYLDSQVAMLERARLSEGGAIVLAGAAGSGKSTTIASLMRGLCPSHKVVTLEDPVEYVIGNALQNTVSRALDGGDEGVFDAKLKTLKRSAMNDLLIGEIRDPETGRAFMDLAGSGVNLYTTTHALSAPLIPERLASDFIGISRDFLATPGILKLLVFQALLPRLCHHCARPLRSLEQSPDAHRWRGWVERFRRLYQTDGDAVRVRNPDGCEACRRDDLPDLHGTAGRTVVAEMIEPAQDEVFLHCVQRRDNLRLHAHMAAIQRGGWHGGEARISAMDCAVFKALRGTIDPRDIELRFRAFETVALERSRPRRLGPGAQS